eukprot:3606210-Rhodomonas_salina.1
MSGTELAYGTIRLRACYAISGTELAYAAICHAMCSTNIAYTAILLLCDMRMVLPGPAAGDAEAQR